MLRNPLLSLALAVLLTGAVGPASAATPSPEFDQPGSGVREFVGEVRDALRSAPELPLEGTKLDSPGALAANENVQHRIIVFQKGTDRARRMAIMKAAGGTVTRDLWLINAVAVVSPRTQLAAMEGRLLAYSEVKRIEPDFIQNWLLQEAAPTEPQPQAVPWGITRVNAPKAWAVTRGARVKVAVVDTGVDYDHADLKVAGGFNAIDPKAPFMDDHGHGTHVSGTIAGADNDVGVIGVAPDVTLYGVKVLGGDGSGSFETVIAGIQWCVENRMDVANFSLGAGQGTEALADAVKAAKESGLTIVAAAGNSGGSVGYPAAYPETIAVAASDSKDKVAYFSSRGPEVAIIAPGVAIHSSTLGGGYGPMSGTSMACPHAAGLAALAVAARGVHGADAIRQALVGAATKFPGIPDVQQGAGMVDALKLVSN
ncbi:MAG: hypothetical protein A2X36_01880 [Elusimicrobia bacterium GWA2_69_24]|nr:MAG: hypothetical protein A2X36_01880 [Elusimicrobia bacterium GWA2_69_24]HBL16521.1 peptidase S8 [Elusimicrobiota bacterium]